MARFPAPREPGHAIAGVRRTHRDPMPALLQETGNETLVDRVVLSHEHAEPPPRLREGVIAFTAARPIKRGEEITIDYRGDEKDRRLWFRARP